MATLPRAKAAQNRRQVTADHEGFLRYRRFRWLKIAGATDGRDHPLEISGTGRLQRDGTLVGDLKSTVGDMSWTAVREAGR